MSDLRVYNNVDYFKYGYSIPQADSGFEPVRYIEHFNEVLKDKQSKKEMDIRNKEKNKRKENSEKNNYYNIKDTYTKGNVEPSITYKVQNNKVLNKTKHQYKPQEKN